MARALPVCVDGMAHQKRTRVGRARAVVISSPPVPHEISRELLEQAKAGSPQALNRLYEQCAGRLLGFIRLRLGRDLRSRLESRDILQSTLLKSLEHLSDLRADETRSVMAWLARIAEHEI